MIVAGLVLLYITTSRSRQARHYGPPFDAYQRDRRLTVPRHMRLAFEEGASWLVQVLGREREEVAAQAAYALALGIEAGLVAPADDGEGPPCT